MANYRINRVNEEIMKEICDIITTVKDPRVNSAFISITGADCTPDLKYAKVFYSVIGDEEGVGAGLKSASGYIRSQLAKRLNLRLTPELKFVPDESIKRGAHINDLLRRVGADKDIGETTEAPVNQEDN